MNKPTFVVRTSNVQLGYGWQWSAQIAQLLECQFRSGISRINPKPGHTSDFTKREFSRTRHLGEVQRRFDPHQRNDSGGVIFLPSVTEIFAWNCACVAPGNQQHERPDYNAVNRKTDEIGHQFSRYCHILVGVVSLSRVSG